MNPLTRIWFCTDRGVQRDGYAYELFHAAQRFDGLQMYDDLSSGLLPAFFTAMSYCGGRLIRHAMPTKSAPIRFAQWDGLYIDEIDEAVGDDPAAHLKRLTDWLAAAGFAGRKMEYVAACSINPWIRQLCTYCPALDLRGGGTVNSPDVQSYLATFTHGTYRTDLGMAVAYAIECEARYKLKPALGWFSSSIHTAKEMKLATAAARKRGGVCVIQSTLAEVGKIP